MSIEFYCLFNCLQVIESDEDENQMDLMIEHHDENNFAPVKSKYIFLSCTPY